MRVELGVSEIRARATRARGGVVASAPGASAAATCDGRLPLRRWGRWSQRRWLRWFIPRSALLVVLACPVLRAEEPAGGVSPPSAARRLFEQGLAHREAGRLREACEAFEASVAGAASPHGWLQVGRCREASDLIAALEAYEAARAAAEQVPDPQRRSAYLSAARERIDALGRRVPTVTFQPSSTPGVVAEVTRLGHAVGAPVDRYDEPLRFNPGRYQVRAWATGFEPYAVEFELHESESRRLALPPLQPAPGAVAAPPSASEAAIAPEAPVAPEALPARDGAAGPVIHPLPVILASGGALLVVSGIVVGQLSSSERRELERGCADPDPLTGQRRCGSELAGTRDRMENLALTADVLWVSGALLAAAGVGLFILDPGDGPHEDAPRVAVRCGPSQCGLSAMGRF